VNVVGENSKHKNYEIKRRDKEKRKKERKKERKKRLKKQIGKMPD